jgi:cytoskeletal protein CcmA (bactofilin family)
MWRKPTDAKANPQSSNVPEPVSTAPKAGPNAPVVTAAPAAPAPIAQNFTPTQAPSVSSNIATPSAPAPTPLRSNSASVIGAGLKIQGEITGDSDLVVEGEAHGRIRMVNGRVTVAPKGRVNADIEAVEISVEGFVQGGLKASDKVRLGPASQVQGSVMTPRIAIEDGARLRGKVEMVRAGEVPTSAAKTPAASTPVSAAPATSVAKVADSTTPAIATEADRAKATAARGSGD